MNLRNVVRSLLFAGAVAGLVAVLSVLNWVSGLLDPSGLRSYQSIEELQRVFPRGELTFPVYFPEPLGWPPAEIIGQQKPFLQAIVHLASRSSGELVLAVRQVASGHSPAPTRLELERVVLVEERRIKGEEARLETGECGPGRLCRRLTWTREDFDFALLGTLSEAEFLRVCESMIEP